MYHDKKKDVLSKKRDDLRYWLRPEESERTTFWLKMLCYFCMASIDTGRLYLSILASSNVTSPFRALIQQGAISISMVVSWFLFKRSPHGYTYTFDDYFGYSWIFVANICREESDGLRQRGGYDQYGMGFYFSPLNCVHVVGWMYEGMGHDASDSSSEYERCKFLVAFNQLLLGVALSPAGFALQQVGTSHRRDVSHLPSNFWDGFKCGVLGIGDIQGNGHDGIDSHGHTGTWVTL